MGRLSPTNRYENSGMKILAFASDRSRRSKADIKVGCPATVQTEERVKARCAVNTRFLGRGSGIHRSKERQDVGHYLIEVFIEEEVARIRIQLELGVRDQASDFL
jgi:hypothetical protein